jgi:hypothetical protein
MIPPPRDDAEAVCDGSRHNAVADQPHQRAFAKRRDRELRLLPGSRVFGLTPKGLDQRIEAGLARRCAGELLGVVECGGDISDIAAEAHERQQGVIGKTNPKSSSENKQGQNTGENRKNGSKITTISSTNADSIRVF